MARQACGNGTQGGSAEVKAGWQPAAAKLTLLGVAYQSGSVRICTAALLELAHLTPSRLRELGLSGGGITTADTAAGTTQVPHVHAKPSGSTALGTRLLRAADAEASTLLSLQLCMLSIGLMASEKASVLMGFCVTGGHQP